MAGIRDIPAYIARFGLSRAVPGTVADLEKARNDLIEHERELTELTTALKDARAASASASDSHAGKAQRAKMADARRVAEILVEECNDSIERTKVRIQKLQANAAKEINTANKKATRDEILHHVDDVKTPWERKFLDVMIEGAPILATNVRIDGANSEPLTALLTNLPKPDELPAAFAAATLRMRNRARDVMSDHAPELLPAFEKPAQAEEPAIPVPDVTLFSVTSPIIYTDARDGLRKPTNRGGNAYLSKEQAALALERRKVVKHDPLDARQNANRATSGSTIPEPHLLYDLDTDAEPDRSPAGMKTMHKPAQHSRFVPTAAEILPSRPNVFEEHPNIKPPYRLPVAGPSAEPAQVAARNKKERQNEKS